MKQVTGAILAGGILAGCALPEAERDPLFDRLAGRSVVYDLPDWSEEGRVPPTRSWAEDGTTVFDTKYALLGKRQGRWEIRRGQYCVQWGPEDPRRIDRTCWDVEFPDEGRVAFVAPHRPWLFLPRAEARFIE